MSDWQNFAVLSVDGNAPKACRWWPSGKLFPAETCARQIFFGVREDFGALPQNLLSHPKTEFKEGAPAYKVALSVMAGLRNYQYIDKEVSGQVKRAFQAYTQRQPSCLPRMESYMHDLFADTKVLKKGFLDQYYRQPTHENVAVELAGLEPQHEALVVGDSQELTNRIVKTLAHKKKTNPSAVYLTHYDPRCLGSLMAGFSQLGSLCALNVPVHSVPFETAVTDHLHRVKAVFVCAPMVDVGSEGAPEAFAIDRTLAGHWGERLARQDGGVLVHMRGNPLAKATTTGPWLDYMGRDGFVPVEVVKQGRSQRFDKLDFVRARAFEAIDHMAQLRVAGERRVLSVALDESSGQLRIEETRPSGHRRQEALACKQA